MATHNQVRIVGYVLNPPKIINEGVEGAEKAIFSIRTVHRDIDSFNGNKFQDLMIFYDGTQYIEKMKKLIQFDVVDIKGVFNVLSIEKRSLCPGCGTTNVKHMGTSSFIYPIAFTKLNALETAYEHDEELPERILDKYYVEVSNQALIIGTVVNDPEMTGTQRNPCCRYRLGVDRKYYIKSQGDITADYPWVYSYGQQAEWDFTHLIQGSLILMDGFVQNRQVESSIECFNCGQTYKYPDVATEFVPYSVEYLRDYLTDEDIARKQDFVSRRNLQKAETAVFG